MLQDTTQPMRPQQDSGGTIPASWSQLIESLATSPSGSHLNHMSGFHLAQINIARLLHPIDHPEIAGFIADLDPINALAEQSPGFIWRLKSSEGNATDIAYNDDPFVIVNMSVWDSIDSLQNYVYKSRHLDIFKQRASWFHKMDKPHYCLWWVPTGHTPTVAEGRARLEHYQQHGSTPHSFWFSQSHPAPTPVTA